MQSNVGKSQDGGRSRISCLSCRRRKVKCDRKFPQCLICEQTSLTCNYPSGPLKPGPKIGSQQRQRKRSRDDEANGDNGHDPAIPRLEHTAPEVTEPQIASRNTASEVSSLSEDTSSLVGDTQGKAAASTDRISDLSFILHPSHETSSPENERTVDQRQLAGDTQQSVVIDKACSTLGLEQRILEQLVKMYFDNMTAINLFHEPSFSETLRRITSPTQLSALLAGMITFAIRFYSDENGELPQPVSQMNTDQRAVHFLDKSLTYIDEALKECGDSTPPLCILQANIIAAHCQLSQGVLGRAWRSLGTCVRLAYEMNLHLVDIGPRNVADADADRWCRDEEKRRAWWAIWEMDVFATTIRRTPPAVDWSQIETLLPVEDDSWFKRNPRPSCFLERDPVYRWKALQDSGNQSPKAWFIVINSLMKDAQRISSPRGVPNLSSLNGSQPAPSAHTRGHHQPDGVNEARQKLETIANAVQCFRMALPSHLKYHDQYLGFDARVPGQYTSKRQEHSFLYNIYMMTQLARLMINRYDVFKGHYRAALSTHDSSDTPATNHGKANPGVKKDATENLAIKQYFEAADALIAIVNRSCDDHIKYINPFIANTIWLASAVHLVRSQFCRPGMNKSVIRSRFEVLNLTYKKCVSFWDMHTQNLGYLEEQLEACQRPDKDGRVGAMDSQVHSTSKGPSHQAGSGMSEGPNPHEQVSRSIGGEHVSPVSYIPNAGEANANRQSSQSEALQPLPSTSSNNEFYTADWQERTSAAAAGTSVPNTSMLDFMQLSSQQIDTRPAISNHIPPPSATLMDSIPFFDTTQPQRTSVENMATSDVDPDVDWSWGYPRLPTDLQDMLSEFFTS